MPVIYNYTDYRRFLKDWCAERRQQSRAFSLRNFARAAGLPSHSLLHMVMRGERSLTEATIPKVAIALKLKKNECRFFADLVGFSQATTNQDKNHYYQRMVRHTKFRNSHKPARCQFEYFSQWYFAAIREMVILPDFREDSAWIARRLKGAVTEREASSAIELLLRLGLCSRESDGRLCVSSKAIATEDDVSSLAVAQYHDEMIDRAAHSLKCDPGDERHVSAITAPMSRATFRKIKKLLNDFRSELHSILIEDDEPEEIFQINLQLFGLTRRSA